MVKVKNLFRNLGGTSLLLLLFFHAKVVGKSNRPDLPQKTTRKNARTDTLAAALKVK
jgi:hypothetical protein